MVENQPVRMSNMTKRPLFQVKDILIVLMLVIAFPISIILNRRWLTKLSKLLTPVFLKSHGGKTNVLTIKHALNIDEPAAYVIAVDSLQARLLSMLLFLKAVVFGSKEPIELAGKSHLDSALSSGSGAILWVAELTYGPDACKVALAEHNYAVSHLSRPEHGFSSSLLGIKFLNPIRTNYELRYLQQRIVFTADRRDEVADQIKQTLANNEVVSFLASGHVGRSLIKTKFLNGHLSMAAGAAAAAYKNDVPLLPVFCRPISESGEMQVTIGEPISLEGESKAESIQKATKEYIARLACEVKANPALFLQWKFVDMDDQSVE